MKSILALLALLALASPLLAQGYRSRAPTPQEERRLSGIRYNLRDEMDRQKTPVFIDGDLFYNLTNPAVGTIFIRTNKTVLVHIVLPNPTNNPGRKFEIGTMGASTAILSNVVVGTFTAVTNMATASTVTVVSNVIAHVYSTGTNYVYYGVVK